MQPVFARETPRVAHERAAEGGGAQDSQQWERFTGLIGRRPEIGRQRWRGGIYRIHLVEGAWAELVEVPAVGGIHRIYRILREEGLWPEGLYR